MSYSIFFISLLFISASVIAVFWYHDDDEYLDKL